MKIKKSILVTGCLGPLGSQICRSLKEEGYRIVGTDLANGSEDTNIDDYFQADLSVMQELENLIVGINARIPYLDGIVNNAAITGDTHLEDASAELSKQTYESFILTLKVNLIAPFILARDLSSKLYNSGNGSIVNIASIYGLVGNSREIYPGGIIPTSAAYSSSKGGLIQLTRYLSSYLAPRVRVNAIAPGGILRNQEREFLENYSARVPLGRMALEADISGVVSFLLSPNSQYITGEVIAVDGGWTSK
jgi:NAD(P)-dependent dehydrogenase (short-subunit alcohol dehydrogenase family)